MKYPLKALLVKINTKEDALYPQPDRYPDGFNLTGYVWEFNFPTVNNAFYLQRSKLNCVFHTSVIQNIEDITNTVDPQSLSKIDYPQNYKQLLLLTTLNSRYYLFLTEVDEDNN